jgi:NADH dehydrogenase
MSGLEDRKRTVVVTGAAGLLGRHLCDHFRARRWEVRALDLEVSQYPFSQEGIALYRLDLPDFIDPESIEAADVLIHCAYMTRFTNLREAKRVNEVGTTRLYAAARAGAVKKFVFISSTVARPDAESYYARSKYKLERAMDPSRDVIIRPGLILASDGGLFNRIAEQVRRLPVIPVFDGGSQVLRTVHIDDLCRVIDWILETDIRGVITVSESEGITMKELLGAVMRRMGRSKPIVSVPGRPFVPLLELLESLKLRLPVSSENLRGLLGVGEGQSSCSEEVARSGIRIRPALESLDDLIS